MAFERSTRTKSTFEGSWDWRHPVFLLLTVILLVGFFLLPLMLEAYASGVGSADELKFVEKVNISRSRKRIREFSLKKQLFRRVERAFQKNLRGVGDFDPVDLSVLHQSLAQALIEESQKFNFEPELILALIEVESNFHIRAKSEKGAVGLMQLRPITVEDVLNRRSIQSKKLPSLARNRSRAEVDLDDPILNLRFGIQYLGYLKSRPFGKSDFDLFAAYLIGPEKHVQNRAQPGYRPRESLRYFNKIQKKREEWKSRLWTEKV